MNLTYEKCGDYLIPNLIRPGAGGRVEEIWTNEEILFGES